MPDFGSEENEPGAMSEEERKMRDEISAEVFSDDGDIGGASNIVRDEIPEVAEDQVEEENDDADLSSDAGQGEEGEGDSDLGDSADLKKSISSMEQRLNDLPLNDIAGRLKQLEGGINAMAERARKAEEAPTPEALAAVAADEQEWKELQEDNPQWKKLFERIDKKNEKKEPEFDAEAFKETTRAEIKAEVEKERLTISTELVASFHKDFRKIGKSPEFNAFLESKGSGYKEKIHASRSPAEVIGALDEFKDLQDAKTKGKEGSNIISARRRNLRRSISPDSGKVTRPAREKPESEMSEAELRAKIAKEVYTE